MGGRERAEPWALSPTALRVAVTVLRRGPVARAELSRLLGLSSASLSRLTQPLVASGLLVEGAPVGRSTGRPALPLAVAADAARFVGVHVADDGAHAVLTDLCGGILSAASEPAERPSPEAAAALVADLVDRVGGRPDGLGVCLDAAVDRAGTAHGAGRLGWAQPAALAPLLTAATGLPAVVGNDVNALTLAEHWFGAGRSCTDFAVVSIGRGVGLGLVVDDELIHGHAGAAGMPGRLRLPCGRRVDDALDGARLLERAAAVVGTSVEASGLAALGEADPRVGAILDEAADAVGLLAGTVACVTAPAHILVTGEGAPLLAGRTGRVRDAVAGLLTVHAPAPGITIGAPAEHARARGAATMALRRHLGA